MQRTIVTIGEKMEFISSPKENSTGARIILREYSNESPNNVFNLGTQEARVLRDFLNFVLPEPVPDNQAGCSGGKMNHEC